MAKRYKTDYFKKINMLASICNDNIFYAQKIISSELSVSEAKPVTGKIIMDEIKSSLAKDYFAPFEREDIFIICEKFNELSENSHLLCICANKTDTFGFPSEIVTLTDCLKKISESITKMLSELLKYPKQGDLTHLFNKTESLIADFKKQLYSCLKRTQNDSYNNIIRITAECADNCKEITTLIQYTLIKNS